MTHLILTARNLTWYYGKWEKRIKNKHSHSWVLFYCKPIADIKIGEGYIKRVTTKRSDRTGVHQRLYQKNRRRVLMTQSICAICGRPVDMSLKCPDPMSPTVDHIIPINKGGHPSDINNLQLAHRICNRLKSDHLPSEPKSKERNEHIKLSCDWKNL